MSSRPGVSAVKYSVCITHRNMNGTIRPSLASVLSQLHDDCEVVVVDALSYDGSQRVLERLSAEGRIVLHRERCTRGEGRDVAANLASHDILVQQVDLDVVYRDVFGSVVDRFLELEAEKGDVCLVLVGSGGKDVGLVVLTICRKGLVEEVGGWPSFQQGEDTLFWVKASRVGELVFEYMDICYAHLKAPWYWRWMESLRTQERHFQSGLAFRRVLVGTKFRRSWKFFLRMPLTVLAYLRARTWPSPRSWYHSTMVDLRIEEVVRTLRDEYH